MPHRSLAPSPGEPSVPPGRARALRRLRLALAAGELAGLLLAAPSLADEPVDVEDVSLDEVLGRDLDDRLGSTTAASRTKERVLTAPAAVSTLTSDDIRTAGARTIAELLTFAPGVQVHRSGPGSFLVALRGTAGITGNNVVVLLNGTPLNNPLDASVDWDLIPVHPSDVERIEVVRGPVSTIYGANAYTGVINIVTKGALGTSRGLTVRVEGGVDTDASFLAGLAGRYIEGRPGLQAGLFANGEVDHTGTTGAAGQGVPLSRAGVMAHLEVSPGSRLQITVDLGGSRSERSSLDSLVLESHPEQRSLVFGAVRVGAQDVSRYVRSIGGWARTVLNTSGTNAALYEGFSYTDTLASQTAAGFDLGLRFGPKVGATAGAQASFEWVDAPFMNPTSSGRGYLGYGFHGSVSVDPLPHLQLTLSGRGDLSPSTARLEGSYRGSAVYSRTDWALRLTAASAYRAPSYVELGGQFRDPSNGLILLEGEPHVQSPRNDTLELGAVLSPITALHIAPTLFVSRLSNVLAEDFDPLVRKSFRNDPDPHDLAGAELEASFNVNDAVTLVASGGVLHWLSSPKDGMVGRPEQNSTFVGQVRASGTFLHERLSYGLGVTHATSRSFALRTGIPPRIISVDLPATTKVSAGIEVDLRGFVPLAAYVRGLVALPGGTPESPLPGASNAPTSVLVGLAYRQE